MTIGDNKTYKRIIISVLVLVRLCQSSQMGTGNWWSCGHRYWQPYGAAPGSSANKLHF